MNPPSEPDLEALIGDLANEFLDRFHRGEQPDIEAYASRYPQFAKVIRQVLAAAVAVKSARGRANRSTPGPNPPALPASPPRVPEETELFEGAGPSLSVSPCPPGYSHLTEVGRGGMGVVCQAWDNRLGRNVALKFLPQEYIGDAGRLERFRREAQAVSALNHPFICTLYDVAESQGGRPVLVMEWIEGKPLRDLVGQGVPLPEVVRLAAQVAQALQAAHAAGIVHRDIKPENIMVRTDGYVKLVDFGLARCLPAQFLQPGGPSANTALGALIGTVHYMSPEQARGEAVSCASDVFSLGTVLYELATGQHPFAADTNLGVLNAIVVETTLPASRLNPDVPARLETLLQRMLAKDPHVRPQAAELATALADLAGETAGLAAGPEVRPDTDRPTGRPKEQAGQPLPPPQRRPSRSRKALDSVAILPLSNGRTDSDLDYLSDGITENLINLLSRLSRLRVMARSTVFRFKGQDINAQEVGRLLNVRAVLVGRLFQRGERVIIKAELVDAADGSQLWGEHFDRRLGEMAAVEEAMATSIAEKLRLRLTGEEKKRLSKRATDNAGAYQLYLKGRYHWNKRTGEGLKKAVQCLEEALALDPAYALAYAGLADCYNMAHLGTLSPREAYPRAKAAAARALEIDENLVEAHTALAFARFVFDWDWAGAERGFQRAIELNPNYARARHAYGSYLLALGRFDEALAEIKRAEELDPLSLIISHYVGVAYSYARRYDQAIAQYGKALELDAQFPWAHCGLGLAYGYKGMYPEAVAALEEARRLDENPTILASLGYALARSGQRAKALQMLDRLQELSKSRPVAPYDMATLYAGLDEKEQAFAWLEKAYEERGLWLPLLRVEPTLDSLRTDPRFAELLRRMHFPPSEADKPVQRPFDSLAILPLVNAAADPDLDYLSDGITESLIRHFSELPRLRVLAWNTVLRYRGQDRDAADLGRALNVRAVLVGSIRQSDDRLIVTAELVDAAAGSKVWGGQYERGMSEIFALEEAIAKEVAAGLRLPLTGRQKRRLGRRNTKSAGAYQLYLKGRYYWNKRTEEGLRESTAAFYQALDRDPSYALAWAGLADAYHQLGLWGHASPTSACARAKSAALRAIELDDSLGEAHTALAVILKDYDWDFAAAERSFQRALELDPNQALAHQWYGECLACMGRHTEAIAKLHRAQDLDPLSMNISATLGRHGYSFARQHDKAVTQLRKTIETDPKFWVAHNFLGWVYLAQGNFADALTAFKTARQLDDNPETFMGLGYTYGVSGELAKAREYLNGLIEQAQHRYVTPVNIAMVYVGLGKNDQAFTWLDKAFEDRSQWLSEMRVDPAFDSLRSDPRFAELVNRMGKEKVCSKGTI